MTENYYTYYTRARDKYGLLQHIRMKTLDSVMEQLEQILIDFKVNTILDLCLRRQAFLGRLYS